MTAGGLGADPMEVVKEVLSWLRPDLEDGISGLATCVQTCLEMQYALGHIGIESNLEAVRFWVATDAAPGGHLYGPPHGSWYRGEVFQGHAVLVMPRLRRFVDPTVSQFREVSQCKGLPWFVEFDLPAGRDDLGDQPLDFRLGQCRVRYIPEPQNRDAWHHPQYDTDFRRMMHSGAGEHAAEQALDSLGLT